MPKSIIKSRLFCNWGSIEKYFVKVGDSQAFHVENLAKGDILSALTYQNFESLSSFHWGNIGSEKIVF